MIVGASVLTFPIARLAQKSGRGTALAVAFALAAGGAGGTIGAVSIESWPLFLVALFLVGGGTVGGLATRFAAADIVEKPASVPLAISLILWAGTIGALLGPNLVGQMSAASHLGPYQLLLILYMLAIAASFAGANGKRPHIAFAAKRRVRLSEIPMLLRKHRSATQGLIITLVSHAAMIALMGMAPVHLSHLQTSAGVVGLIMSAHLVAMYVLSPVFGMLARWRGAGVVGVAGLILSGVSAVILALASTNTPWLFPVGLTLLGFAWSMGIVAGSALVSGKIPEPERGVFQGLTDLGMNVSGGVFSVLAGLVMAALSYEALAWTIAAIVLVVLGGFLRPPRTRGF